MRHVFLIMGIPPLATWHLYIEMVIRTQVRVSGAQAMAGSVRHKSTCGRRRHNAGFLRHMKSGSSRYCCTLFSFTQRQDIFHLKGVLPLAKQLVTASCHVSKTVPRVAGTNIQPWTLGHVLSQGVQEKSQGLLSQKLGIHTPLFYNHLDLPQLYQLLPTTMKCTVNCQRGIQNHWLAVHCITKPPWKQYIIQIEKFSKNTVNCC